MKKENSREEKVKEMVAFFAANLVPKNSIIGLGSGTTASMFILALGKRNREEPLNIRCVATSKQSETLGRQQGLPLMTSWDEPIDITFDGADLVDTEGTAVKGLGGALLREKIVATNSCKLILLIDERKMQNSPSSFILPIAVIPFGIHATMKTIEKMGFHSTLRMQEKNPFVSDDGYWILDISMGGALRSLKEIDVALKAIPGVVETGLFYRLASEVIIGYSDGRVERHPFF